VSAVLLAVSLAVLCALVGVTAGAGPASAFYRSPSCGGTTILKSDGTPWVCTFDDEFSSTTLDTTKWTAWNGVNYNTNPSVCYYSDAQHVYVRNGYLNLAVAPLSSPQTCITGSGTVQATYGGGLVHTLGHFSQTYGRFEARIKFGGGNGVHDDFWLYPTSNNYPGQAEIDVAEPFGSMPNTMSAVTHVTGADGKDDGAWAPCTLNSWASGFHTYTLVWTPTAITFSYDGVQCMNFTNWSTVAGYADPAPFNQPFFMILQTLVDGGDGLAAPDTTTTFPAVTQVDYVRAWK
jgi:beta-glucanase (GH16 family)